VDTIPVTALHAISGKVTDGTNPIPGVTITLKSGSGVVLGTTVTLVDGTYSFSGLPDGSYTVVETNPVGATSVSDADGALNGNDLIAVTLSGADQPNEDFVDTIPVTALHAISGKVTDGTNPIPGVMITLKSGSGVTIGTTVTAADGTYSFPGLPNGSYSVNETDPAGATSTSPNTIAVTLNGADVPNQDFTDTIPAAALHAISGVVFNAAAATNTTFSLGDTPIGNVTVSLYRDVNANGIADAGELIGSDVTATDGSYSFGGLPAGAYLVTETNPAGAVSVTDVDGMPNGADRIAVSLTVADVTGRNFLDKGVALHSISGKVTDGTNPIPGVIITLKNGAGAVIVTETTAGDGTYSLPNLPDGNYTVVETNPVGTTGGSDADGPANTNDVIAVALVGADKANQDFTDTLAAGSLHSISGVVLKAAAAGNTTFSLGDTPIANVTVSLFLDINANGIAESGELITTGVTLTDGSYSFGGLPAGTYLVTETNPAGAVSVTDVDGTLNGTDRIAVTLAGADATGRNFLDDGITLHGISGIVTDGTNPIPGVLITLKNGAGAVLQTTSSAADGSYSFGNLPDGTYTVVETNPIGTTGGSDADGPANTNDVIAVALVGADKANQDFIDTLAAGSLHSISGVVFKDGPLNNHTFDAGDIPIASVTVSLYRDINGDGIAQAGELIGYDVTNATGAFTFPRLAQGAYLLVETNPAGAVSDTDADGSANGKDLIAVTLGAADVTARNFLDSGIVLNSISGSVSDGANPIPGVVVTLINSNGDRVGAFTTLADGKYTFPNLPDGVYTIKETNPPGTTGGSDFDSGNPDSTSVTLAGTSILAANFFDLIPTAITDRTVFAYCKSALSINVLKNIPPSGTGWTIVSVSTPAHGTLTIQPNGYVLFTPNINFLDPLTDSFTVRLSDGMGAMIDRVIDLKPANVSGGLFLTDTKTDIVWQDTASGLRVLWYMNGSTYTGWANLGYIPTEWQIAATGDFNNDGQADIVWQDTATGQRVIWFMNRGNFIGWADLGVVPTNWQIAGTGDFNGDGKPDILWQDSVTGMRGIWYMNGATFVSWASLGVVSTNWLIAGTADFNGDGKPDILWQDSVTGMRGIWYMNGATFVSWASLGVVSTNWLIAGTADFNGDGKPDILWQDSVTGMRGVWFMNGTTFVSSASFGVVPTNWQMRKN
jgi:hypothetical protein